MDESQLMCGAGCAERATAERRPWASQLMWEAGSSWQLKSEYQPMSTQYNIKQTYITAHHPASNGLVERTNRKILEILRQLAGKFQET